MRATLVAVVTKGLAVAALLGALVLVTGAARPGDRSGDFCATPADVSPSASYGAPVELPDDSAAPLLPSRSRAPIVPPTPLRRAERPSMAGIGGACPEDMLLVDGDEFAEVEEPCLEWAAEAPGEEEKMRCLRFGPSRCMGKLTHARFCIDRYEYPNVKGRLPMVMKTWTEAVELCVGRRRRLCKGAEWTLACEGEERLPYPYGHVRDDSACNIDRPLAGPYPRMITPRPRGVEISLVDWRSPSGAMDRCASPFGVHDMTGNVDEWVVNESGHPYESWLKGGYWGPVRDRCRPMTVAHDERFAFYQIGFRCCADEPVRAAGSAAPTPRPRR